MEEKWGIIMKNANKIKVVAILMVGCMALTLVSKSLISWARELSLDEIKEIRDKIPPDMQIEVFVHGAMCMSFSGRCS